MAGPTTRRPLLVALAAGLVLTALTDWRVGLDRQANFLDRLEDTAARLETLPARHQAMGAALTLAGLAPASREAVAGRLPPDAPEALAALGFAATAVQASNAFLVDERGTIVAYHLESGRSATGRNLAQRPYVKSALAGHPNMYAAVGSNTQERGIYVAAPVRADAGQGNRVIGAAVIKVGFDQVDPLLAQDYADYALVSPEGVVFASTQAAWRYTVAAGTADLAHVARHDRAANHFAGHTPRPLADLVPNLTTAQALPVDWADPEGAWQLLGLPRQRFGLSWLEALLVLVSGSGLSIAGLAWRRQRQQREQERRQAEQELAGYALRLEQIAEQKSRIAALTAQLQQADGVASLAAVFLEATAGMLGARQGTVYYLAGDGALHLAAGYGCAAGEAARPPRHHRPRRRAGRPMRPGPGDDPPHRHARNTTG